jgi:4-oxalomesaconate hydratase
MTESAEKHPRVLAFSAHAADYCSRTGATLAKYARAGSPVRVVALTYGERGESGELWRARPDLTIDQVKAIRRTESEASAQALGVEIRFLDWNDYPLFIGEERLLALVDEIREFRPDIVLTHWRSDELNQDHQYTAEAVIRACSCANAAGQQRAHRPVRWPEVFFFESGVPQTEFNGFNPDTFVDVTDTFALKLEALARFKAQPVLQDWYRQYGERRGWQARSYSGRAAIKYAEGFVRYRPQVCDWLH